MAGRAVHYRTAGAGPPVILVHGLSGSFRWWGRNIEALGRRLTVYAIDLPGFGDNRGRRAFVLKDAADHLLAWMDAAGIDRASVIGHSMGGSIAIDLASSVPERVDRLLLVDTPALPDARGLVQLARDGAAAARRLPLRFVPVLLSDALRAGPFTIGTAGREMLAADLTSRLSAIAAPALVIWGAEDHLFPPAYGRLVADALPGSGFIVIDKAGHNPMWDQPAAFNHAAIAFLTAP